MLEFFKAMKVGLFFGSFNPVHIGHLILADYFAQYTDLDQVWMVLSPRNPLKEKSSLLEDHHRLAMLRLAVEDNPRLKDSNIEFGMEKPSYTVNTLAFLRDKYPENEFALIMGEDNLRSFHKWKNYELILAKHQILVYPRIISQTEKEEQKDSRIKDWLAHPNVRLLNAPAIQISATQIREAIRNKKDVRYVLSEPVYTYCKEMHFYEK